MFAAAVQGDVEVVVMALQEGADVEARNVAGLTVTQVSVCVCVCVNATHLFPSATLRSPRDVS